MVEHLRTDHEVLVLTSTEGRERTGTQPHVHRVLPMLARDWRGSLRAPLASLRCAREVDAALDELEPDLVYVWNGALLPTATFLRLDGREVPVAFRVCEYWFGLMGGDDDQFLRHLRPGDRGARRLWALLMRAFNRLPWLRIDPFARLHASISWNSEFLRAATAIPDTVTPLLEEVLHPALPQGERFARLTRDPAPEPTVLFFGRLSPEKGVDVACRALADLREEHGIAARLVLAGPIDPAMRAQLDRLVGELSIGSAVELTGPLDEDALAVRLGEAHVVVVPPTWQEPAGMVTVEAALARVPIVASRSGGIPEMFSDEEHLLMFEIGDHAECARLIAETLEDAGGTAARVERARQRAGELSFAHYILETERFLERASVAGPAAQRAGSTSS